MGSPITFSGFNSIDFTLILNSIMTQESQPLTALQTRQTALQARATGFDQLTSRVVALQQAAAKLTGESFAGFAAVSNDPEAVSVSAGAAAQPGRYDVVVTQLARAQVTASTTTAPDADTTIVASGGTITIGDVTVTLAASATLQQLADAINQSSDPPARATVVQTGPSSYRLVLTARDTGAANAFTITNNLTGGTGISFGANAVDAADAAFTVNNIPVTSASNTVDAAIPGVSLTLFRQDPASTIAVDVTTDNAALKERVQTFITAYNDLVKFATDQSAAAGRGEESSIGRDPLLRQLRAQLRGALSQEYATGGALTALSQAGIQLTRTGTLELDETQLGEAIAAGTATLATLFTGDDVTPGVFAGLDDLLAGYTQADGLLPGARKQLTEQASRFSDQIAAMQERLALRRAALQREFIAADQAMSMLKSQSSSLAQFGAQL
ncbi:MAG: flagellar filament capping protein FliD [Vicinamibacterales bacterium]